jgi:transposase
LEPCFDGKVLRVASGSAEGFVERVKKIGLTGQQLSEVAPLLAVLLHVNQQIEFSDGVLQSLARQDKEVERLCTVPSVGPVTAVAFVATVDKASRFNGAHQVEAYLGLVPSEMSSGEKQHRGRITKAGDSRLRRLLVQVAVSMMRLKNPGTAALRAWATRVGQRRGQRVAMVALARRLAGVLYAMMRDGTSYKPLRLMEATIQKVA